MASSAKAKKPVILIYDDEQGSAASIKEQLNDIPDAEIRLLESAKAEVEILERRRRSARNRQYEEGPSAFDEADILIVDYDLTSSDDSESGPAETGERVAYLSRCYSRCRTIVGLNRYNVTATFDLSLISHIESYADLNITGDQIGNPALWGRKHEGFAPWSWPDLMKAPELQRQREILLKHRSDDAALVVLGLQDDTISNTLSRNQLAWLSPDRIPSQATVDDVVRRGRLGLRPSDGPWGEDGLARVAAARLAKWLEGLVLPGQNVLVDAPHLVSRFPSLSTGDLDETTQRGSAGSVGLDDGKLRAHRFSQPHWLSRPAWTWPTVSDDEQIAEVSDPFSPVKRDQLFTEDSSVFREEDWCRPFAADVEPFSRRYVTRQARRGEARHPPYSGAYGLGRVQYQPQLRFAL